MSETRHAIGVDVSTQSVAAMLIGIVEHNGAPAELVVSDDWTACRPYSDETGRRRPTEWVELVRECVAELRKAAPETGSARAIGVSTTFPGTVAILAGGTVDPDLVSLYDNTDDAGLGDGSCEARLARAEDDTLNRMWPGNMAVGLAHLVKSHGLRLEEVSALVPLNTAFSYALLRAAGAAVEPSELVSDFTETVIGGLYDVRTYSPIPDGVAELLQAALGEIDIDRLRSLIPKPAPSWRNVVPGESLGAVRELLGLPKLDCVSVGAGDSPLGTLALHPDRDTMLVVRGSTDSPMLLIEAPVSRSFDKLRMTPRESALRMTSCESALGMTPRETVLHYPLPTVTRPDDVPWCVVAPTLRSGKVWDWVRRLRFPDPNSEGDAELEQLAAEALKRRLRAPEGSLERRPLRFETALGGERAPEWDPRATGTISGLIESHSIGDIALAALEGMSLRLRACLNLMEERYDRHPSKLLLAGGPVHNKLWNWVTQVVTGKRAYATTFSDASLLGAAMLGYGASYDGSEDDTAIAQRLRRVSDLASAHSLIQPTPVAAPDDELAGMEGDYAGQFGS